MNEKLTTNRSRKNWRDSCILSSTQLILAIPRAYVVQLSLRSCWRPRTRPGGVLRASLLPKEVMQAPLLWRPNGTNQWLFGWKLPLSLVNYILLNPMSYFSAFFGVCDAQIAAKLKELILRLR